MFVRIGLAHGVQDALLGADDEFVFGGLGLLFGLLVLCQDGAGQGDEADAEENAERMVDAAASVVTGELTQAVRDWEAARAAEVARLETLWPGAPRRRARPPGLADSLAPW